MNNESHRRARKLLAAARIEGIKVDEREWLDRHLSECRECSREAQTLSAAIQSLRTLFVTANPDLVRRTSVQVRHRAQETRTERPYTALIGITSVMLTLWVVLTTPYMWQAFAWLGHAAHVPNAVWELGFLMWWFLPATVVGAVAVWRRNTAETAGSDWIMETHWGRL